MKVLATNIVYSERTREWNIDINKVKAYKDYSESQYTDKNTCTFGDFMSFGADLPTELEVEVPYNSLFENISEIEDFVKQKIKYYTSRDVQSVLLAEIN